MVNNEYVKELEKRGGVVMVKDECVEVLREFRRVYRMKEALITRFRINK